MRKFLFLAVICSCSFPALAQETPVPTMPADPVLQQVDALRDEWAVIKYQTPDKAAQKQALSLLESKAADVEAAFPDRAEPKIWEGIILATDAGIDKGLSALPKVKKAKALFEAAEAIDPEALAGSAHTSLGSLYYQVPSWPIAFGDDEKAKEHLQMALQMNPDGIDANYFYGDFLIHQKKYDQAVPVLEKALQAPPRPGREIADAGRRDEIQADLKIAQQKLGSGGK